MDTLYVMEIRDSSKREKDEYDRRLNEWDATSEKRRGMTKRHVAALRNQALGRVQACNLILSFENKEQKTS